VASLNVDQAKERVLLMIGSGSTVAAACEAAGRTTKTYENWRASDREFSNKADIARAKAAGAKAAGRDVGEQAQLRNLSFADWRKRFLGRDTYPHQQLWIDVLEGKEPKPWHPAIYYKPANPRRVLINTPPYHAKSATITQEYVTYRLCMNPSIRVLIISKTAEMASSFLYSIKTMLTDPEFAELQLAYGPPEGFKPQRGEGRWAANAIYLADRNLDAADKAAKDPSVTVAGIGGQVYSRRADLIILDDCVDDGNASAFAKQFDWLNRTVLSRNKTGIVALVGTRVAPLDLYRHVQNADLYVTGESPWTVLKSPAVLQFADDPKDWVTLWPKSSQALDENGEDHPDEDGLYPAWDGPALASVRADNNPQTWAMVYQQEDVSEEMTFHPVCVRGSVNGRRKPGPLIAGAWGHPKGGAEGMRVIGSIDPAGTGEAFMMVIAVDRLTRERYVLNAWMGTNTTPKWYAERIEEITPQYGVHEWVVEQNGYASWLIHDERIREYCQSVGVGIIPHFTGAMKQDPDFGVASMQSLFGALKRRSDGQADTGQLDHDGNNIIHLPDPDVSPGIKALIEQLVSWVPGKSGAKLRMDGPMCLWFAELRARLYVMGRTGDNPPASHARSRFMTPRAINRQGVVPVNF
jgi:hypothetical protein